MFKNDLILEMVESLGRNIGKVITDEEDEGEKIVVENLSDKDMLQSILRKMIYDKNYNEAENNLFDFVSKNNHIDISDIGEWFYKELSSISDEELISNNFSRIEIEEGLKDFKRIVNK